MAVDDAEPRRALMDMLDNPKRRKHFVSQYKKACKALVNEQGYSALEAIKIVLSCNRGEVDSEDSELIGRAICDLYKLAKVEDERIRIINFISDNWRGHNLRGTIKKPLMGFEFEGQRPFPFIRPKDEVLAGVQAVIDDANGGPAHKAMRKRA